jgi:Tol biopolymer transport system component
MRPAAWIVIATTAACGGGGGNGGDPDAGAPDATPADAAPAPASEIGLVPGQALTAGEWIVANDWAGPPDVVFALPAADLGGARTVVLTANRVWSLGVRADGAELVFSSSDPEQEADFGITIGDAIQNTFRYDAATETVALLAPAGSDWINANDECHEPTADGAYVYVCRRYDFTAQGAFLGWRIGRIDAATGAFEFLRPDAPAGPWELGAQAIPGTTRILYEQRTRPPGVQYSLWTRDLATGAETMVRTSAGRPTLAPDGHRVLFHDTTNQFRLWMLDLDAAAAPAIPVTPTTGVGDSAWSPDGDAVVYTVYDDANTCDHLERVDWGGAAWSTPVRVRDCTQTGEFITDLSWIRVP